MRLWLAGVAAPVVIWASLSGAPAMAQGHPHDHAAPAAIQQAPDTALAARIDAVVDRAVADQRLVGAVVLVARDGRLVYHRAAGLADREAKAPMRENTVFRLASVTKPFVSAAIMRLAEEGKLSLADPVTKWLPDFKPTLADGSTPTITLGQLLSHTAGLTYGLAEKADHPYHQLGVSDGLDISGLTLDEDVARIGKGPLAFAPGSAWRYSLAIDVLGLVAQKADGHPLPQVVARTVTGPLGLKDAGFQASDPARLATPYANASPAPTRITDNQDVSLGATAVRMAPSRAVDPAAFPSGGAGMVGTAGDVLALLEAVRTGGGPILSAASVQAMTTDQAGIKAATQGPGWGFGYGWAVLDDPAIAKTPQGAGTLAWGGVYGHNWFVDPQAKLTVVLLTNTAFEGMNGQVTRELRDAVYGR
ncbi:serine hydrolase [Caulobacter flavus]|uniref:Serine hydrolase n=1 Tax=Caulobacter flavus TaxID=1679497 RepID=A0A2N5CZQ0_9CAUL|nr:serine hydrolase domain-containing protein [Caulobacter flavus]AYV45047.1 serine hydrolase [Caulobacter flavus]PLR19271.1 serine hydrolase [Caulobacter flavus]